MRTRASLDPKEQFKASVMNKLLMHPEVIAEMQKKFGAAEATTQAEAKKEEKVEAKKDAVPEVEFYLQQKKSFNIEMTGFDQTKKIVIIKELKTLTGLGLKETKDLVDKLPSLLFKDLKKDDAEKMADTLKTLGCVVKLV